METDRISNDNLPPPQIDWNWQNAQLVSPSMRFLIDQQANLIERQSGLINRQSDLIIKQQNQLAKDCYTFLIINSICVAIAWFINK